MLPERNVIRNSAKSVFFEDVNNIDIYIEDTAFGYEKLFIILLSNAFGDTYKLEKIFPLGGRKAVIDAHANQEKNRGRPSLFIIDSDLFILAGDCVSNQPGLFKLPFYCIENILIDSSALCELLYEEDPLANKDDLEKEFKFDEWVVENQDRLFELFVEYAITLKTNPTEKTVSYQIKYLVSSNTGDIDEAKLRSRINELKQKSIDMVGVSKYEDARNEVLNNFETSGVSKLDVISGKDYLFPLLKMRFKSIVKTSIPDINFKHRLAMKCNANRISLAVNYVNIV